MGGFLDSLDISRFVPSLGTMVGFFVLLLVVAVMAGPILMFLKGYRCFFRPAKKGDKANGFSTAFSTGSDDAWSFTQLVAGFLLGVVGALLAVVMLIVFIVAAVQGMGALAYTAVWCMVWEVIVVALTYGIIYAVNVVYINPDFG